MDMASITDVMTFLGFVVVMTSAPCTTIATKRWATPPSELPAWYTGHRTHAHTRLPIASFCHNQQRNFSNASCTWTAAISGRSPGSNLGHVAANSLDECRAACCRLGGCMAVTYFTRQASVNTNPPPCVLLDRLYNGSFAPSTTSIVSNALTANRSGGDTNWTCDAVFENAASDFAGLGVPAYVRHSHTADEGTWWPSRSGPRASWHPLVQATGRNLPKEFLTKASSAGVHVILYHYMKCSAYWGNARPDWVMRWPDGTTPIMWQRGIGMSPCSSAWRQLYISQVVELIAMGADAFFFDEFPGSPTGDWNPMCVELFKERYGYAMPTDHTVVNNTHTGIAVAVSTSKDVLMFMDYLTERYFEELVAAITNATLNKPTVALIGTHLVPAPDNGGSVYETTELLSFGAKDVAKSEFATGTRTECKSIQGRPCVFGGDPFSPDVLASFGWAVVRDAAQGRPPHIWIPDLRSSNQSLCTFVASRTYGVVANPDHTESQIPNTELFESTYKLSKLLDTMDGGATPLPLDLTVIRYTAVLFSEASRAALIGAPPSAESISTTWHRLLYPTVGAWEALVREGVPAAIVVDNQLLSPATRHDNSDSNSNGNGDGNINDNDNSNGNGDGNSNGKGNGNGKDTSSDNANGNDGGFRDGNGNGNSNGDSGGGDIGNNLVSKFRVIVATPFGSLTAAIEHALTRYISDGGVVIRLPLGQWDVASERSRLESELVHNISMATNGLGNFKRVITGIVSNVNNTVKFNVNTPHMSNVNNSLVSNINNSLVSNGNNSLVSNSNNSLVSNVNNTLVSTGNNTATTAITATPNNVVHTVGFTSNTHTNRRLYMMTNNFTECIPSASMKEFTSNYPIVQTNVYLEITVPSTYTHVITATDLISGEVKTAAKTNGLGWTIDVGTVEQHAVISVLFG